MVLASPHDTPAPRKVEPGAAAALIVPVVAGEAPDQSRAAALARGLLDPLAPRFAARVAAESRLEDAESRVKEWLSQATRLLLLPFGRAAGRELFVLVARLERALAQVSGEEVSRKAFPTPSGAVTRPIFAPLEGVACAEAQLAPLLRLFPGWPGQYLCLSSGEVLLALLCHPAGGVEQAEQGEEARAALGLLEVGLGLREGRWKVDGEIFVSYVQSLVGAVLRGPVLQCPDALQSYASPYLLTPTWLRGGCVDSCQ